MPLSSIKLFALAAYLTTFTTYNDDIIEVSNVVNGGYGVFYSKMAEYEQTLMENENQQNFASKDNIQHEFPEVTLPGGTLVKGRQYSKTRTFHNIPYAQAPIGNLRLVNSTWNCFAYIFCIY